MIIIFSFYLSPNCIHCKCKIKRRHNLGKFTKFCMRTSNLIRCRFLKKCKRDVLLMLTDVQYSVFCGFRAEK